MNRILFKDYIKNVVFFKLNIVSILTMLVAIFINVLGGNIASVTTILIPLALVAMGVYLIKSKTVQITLYTILEQITEQCLLR